MDRNVYEACSNIIKEFGTHVVSADEVLAEKIDNAVPIPFKTREEIDADVEKIETKEFSKVISFLISTYV